MGPAALVATSVQPRSFHNCTALCTSAWLHQTCSGTSRAGSPVVEEQLISSEALGNRKPIQLLRRMQQLLGDKLGSSANTNSFLRELFLQRLPASVLMVLASADPSTCINKLTEIADKVMEVAVPSISTVSHVSTDQSELTQLREEVVQLTELVQSLNTRPKFHRSRSISRSYYCSATPTQFMLLRHGRCSGLVLDLITQPTEFIPHYWCYLVTDPTGVISHY